MPHTLKKIHQVPDLVFDIGLHRGDDAAYYISLGYSVLGIEANPLLADACKIRFEKEIRAEQMKVINAGLLKESGEFIFFRNLLDDGWSSFLPQKGKKGGNWEEVIVPCLTTRQLIEEHGKPFFMKVDIEDADFQSLYSMNAAIAPAYISLELNCFDPTVERLIELGYSAFKFVNGATYRPTPPIFDHETGWRLLRKAGRLFPLVRKTISRLPQSFRPKSEYDPPGSYSPTGYPFGPYSSGPFGEEAAGSWMTAGTALCWFENLKKSYRKTASVDSFWWDVHARHSSITPTSR